MTAPTPTPTPDTSHTPETVRRVLIVGAGFIARQHAAAVPHLPGGDTGDVEVLVADPVEAAREGFLAEVPAARALADPAAMLAEPAREGDVVIVATPPFTHRDLALRALATGRHVLCEKPFAMDDAEADAMFAAASAAGRELGDCASRMLSLPATVRARELVGAGAIGTPYHATWVHRIRRGRGGIEYQPGSTWFLDRSRSGGGPLMDWGPYDISTLFHVLRPDRVTVSGAWVTTPAAGPALPPGTIYDIETHAGATLRLHRAGAPDVTVTWERASCTHGEERAINEITGDTGAIRWDWLDWVGDGTVTVTTDDDGTPVETSHRTDLPAVGVHQRPLVDFAAHLRGEPSAALTGERAALAFRTIRAVYDSAAAGGAAITVTGALGASGPATDAGTSGSGTSGGTSGEGVRR